MSNVLLVSKSKSVYNIFNKIFEVKNNDGDFHLIDCIIEASTLIENNQYKFLIYDTNTYKEIFIEYLLFLQKESDLSVIIYANNFIDDHFEYIKNDNFPCYLTKDSATKGLIPILDIIDSGVRFIAPEVLLSLAPNTYSAKLSIREIEITKLIKQCYTNCEIATKLNLSISTIKSHIYNIYKKLNIANRKELLTLIN